MNPAITSIHYHLRPGGVTEVIRHHHRILSTAGIRHEILCGDNPTELPATIDPAFDYATPPHTPAPAAFHPSRFPSSLLHFHNPCLGKNPALTAALAGLAAHGHALLLHHHDLAEDARPDMLARLADIPQRYPVSPRIGHAFINSRDRDLFLHAGLPADRAYLLPNPFTPLDLPPPATSGPATVVLPMRGIPRKNLAEFLLLAAAAPPGTRFLQASAPENPAWRENYDEWRTFAASLHLPVTFNAFSAGRGPTLATATHLLTTSTREGFGMIHLEAAGSRRVIGRLIPHLVPDLEGFPACGLYQAILIDDTDFPTLTAEAQRRAITATAAGREVATVIYEGNRTSLRSWLAAQLSRRSPGDASAALARHSDPAQLQRLTQIARTLLAAPAAPLRFLDPLLIAHALS